jgi:hypothetical protein
MQEPSVQAADAVDNALSAATYAKTFMSGVFGISLKADYRSTVFDFPSRT